MRLEDRYGRAGTSQPQARLSVRGAGEGARGPAVGYVGATGFVPDRRSSGSVSATDVLQPAGTGDPATLAALLLAGDDPNCVHPQSGATPLHNACFCDSVEHVKVLLAHGANPSLRYTYRSFVDGRVEPDLVALMIARSVDVALALLHAGADPNATDGLGRTPLMRAVLAGPPGQVQRLLEAGADPLRRSHSGVTAADIVRDRLSWLRDNLAVLKRPIADERIAKLERTLDMVVSGRGDR